MFRILLYSVNINKLLVVGVVVVAAKAHLGKNINFTNEYYLLVGVVVA